MFDINPRTKGGGHKSNHRFRDTVQPDGRVAQAVLRDADDHAEQKHRMRDFGG